MNFFNLQLLIGFILAILISSISFKIGFLSKSGAFGACTLGTIVFGLGGFSWAVVLMGFFISSSILSKLFKNKKIKIEEKFSKSSKRDIWQVWANGGIAGIFVIFHAFFPNEVWPWLAFCGSIAAVNADTWATEIGVLSKKAPVNIVTGKVIEPGASGGVSILGTSSALLAALSIAFLGMVFLLKGFPISSNFDRWIILIAISAAGLLGSLVDSFLGATVQAIYHCPVCEKETEKHPIHSCGTITNFQKGWKWFNNDWVNTICALTGGLVMVLFIFV